MLDKAPNGRVSHLLNALDTALSAGEVERAVDLFQADCYWRDLVTFTWNIKTMEGKEQICDMLNGRLTDTKPSNWKIADGEDASEANGITESWIQFETEVARGFGHMRLKDGRIWTLLTTMSELKGHEEPVGFDRPMGVKHGAERNRNTWKEDREAEAAELGYSRQPYCVIVGGGQGGIALGARLRQLNVPTIIIEKNERPGDSWRRRYKSLCLHDPVWYDHLPYLPFPRNWPVFSPKDKIGDWLEMYTKVTELNTGAQPNARRRLTTRRAANGPLSCSATERKSSSSPNSSYLRRECQPRPTCRNSKAWRFSREISTIRRSIQGRTNTRTRKLSSSARTIPPTIFVPRSWDTAQGNKTPILWT